MPKVGIHFRLDRFPHFLRAIGIGSNGNNLVICTIVNRDKHRVYSDVGHGSIIPPIG